MKSLRNEGGFTCNRVSFLIDTHTCKHIEANLYNWDAQGYTHAKEVEN